MTTTHHRAPAPARPAFVLIALLAALAVVGCGVGGPAATDGTGAQGFATTIPSAHPTAAAPTDAFGAAEPTTRPTVRPTAKPTPRPTVTPEPTPEPPREAFAMNLYRRGDFVAQYNFELCVGASLQMALNMATDETHTSRTSQQDLWEMAQARSSSPFGGANPRGWTAALNDLGIGPYVLVSIPDFDEALSVAAKALAETDRPVGLVMWRGRHAWVMSGFESIGDPTVHDNVEVTGIRVLDPLYPHGSGRWGPSPKPNALVSPATLARQFVIRDSTRVNLGVPPGYLLVLPITEAAAT